jgi:hypothetical protein
MRNGPSAPVFSTVFGVTYLVCFLYDVALFRYYPQVTEFHLGEQPASLGPPILWYGWVGMSAMVSLVIAMLLPSRIAARIPSVACWIVTGVVVLVMLVLERRWFV